MQRRHKIQPTKPAWTLAIPESPSCTPSIFTPLTQCNFRSGNLSLSNCDTTPVKQAIDAALPTDL